MNPHHGRDRDIGLFVQVFWVTALCSALVVVGCTRTQESTVDRHSPEESGTVGQARAPSPPLECPGALASQPTGHKVVLTWTASRSSTGPNDKSMGYCVYRSDHKIVPDKLEDCHDCKKITPAPIFGTGCVDDFGNGSNTYYYAALAVNSIGQKSKFSNKTEAKFSGKKPKLPLNNQNYPACRPSSSFNAVSPTTLPPQ